MRERYKDDEAGKTTVDRDDAYFKELFYTAPRPGEQDKEKGFRPAFLLQHKLGFRSDLLFIGNGNRGDMVTLPVSGEETTSGALIRENECVYADKVRAELLNPLSRQKIEKELGDGLRVFGACLNEMSNMPHREYKARRGKSDSSFFGGTAYISPDKLREICPRGTVGNINFSYNFATGQLGVIVYRGEKWERDLSIRTNKAVGERYLNGAPIPRPLNNENNLFVARVIDACLDSARERLLNGKVDDADIERIQNGATGMPTVYMGTALLKCPESIDRQYKTEENQAKIANRSLKGDFYAYDISDFFGSDRTGSLEDRKKNFNKNEAGQRAARSFFSFEDCGKRENSSFKQREKVFKEECAKESLKDMDRDRLTSDSKDYVTGPCDYYSNIQKWNNNEENIISPGEGVVIGDIDAINIRADGDRLLISIHEGKTKKYDCNNDNSTFSLPQGVFYRIFTNMLRIGTEREGGLYLNIGGKEYKVELNSAFSKVYGVSRCEIKEERSNVTVGGREDEIEIKVNGKMGKLAGSPPPLKEIPPRESLRDAWGESADAKDFQSELKAAISSSLKGKPSSSCLVAVDKYALYGLDFFIHDRSGIIQNAKKRASGTSFIFGAENDQRTHMISNRGFPPKVNNGNGGKEYRELMEKKNRLTSELKKNPNDQNLRQKLGETRGKLRKHIKGVNVGYRLFEDKIADLSGIDTIKESYKTNQTTERSRKISEVTKVLGKVFYPLFYKSFSACKL